MKKLLLSIFIILIALTGFSQTYTVAAIDTTSTLIPRYLLVDMPNNTKDTVGVIVTIKQAQKINTDLEILRLYRGLHTDCDSTVNYLVQTVEDYKIANTVAENALKASDSVLKDRSLEIENLKQQLVISNERLAAKDSIIVAKDDMITLVKKESKKFKKQRNRAIGVAIIEGLIIIGIISSL
jgi:hypothetical protein